MDLGRENMASHLLAALSRSPPLSLPPILDRPPYHTGSEQQSRDRPLPLEPSATQDVYRSSQFKQGGREPSDSVQQTPGSVENGGDAVSQDSRPDTQQVSGDSSSGAAPLNTTVQHGLASANSTTATGQPGPVTKASGPRPYANILPSATPGSEILSEKAKPTSKASAEKTTVGNRRVRRKWTEEETQDLIKGCHIHGVGNWKKVLDDPRFRFNGRSSVDLKDRFRTCFPKEYRKESATGSDEASESDAPHVQATSPGEAAAAAAAAVVAAAAADGTPTRAKSAKPPVSEKKKKATKTELHHAEVLEKLGIDGPFKKVQRRERREFTSEEDQRLLQGFTIYGASWSRIQNDPALSLHHRRSTDLRDRFRNAFPDKYESAGFKARPRQRPKPATASDNRDIPRVAGEASENAEEEEDDDRGESSLDGSAKGDSATMLMHSLLGGNLSPSWGNHDGAAPPSDQSPAPGSLALDPALGEGFGSSLEEIADDFLAVAQGGAKERTQQAHAQTDLVRWEDMAAHPIFELEPSMASTGQAIGIPKKEGIQYPPIGASIAVQHSSKKRSAEGASLEKADRKKVHVASNIAP